jgi:hypothetical protein
MSFKRVVPVLIVMVAALGCRLENPAFEDDGDDTDDDDDDDDDAAAEQEAGSSIGENTDAADDPIDGESETTTSNSDADGSSEESAGEESTSEESTSEESAGEESTSEESASEGVDGLDAPEPLCPVVFPEETCFDCMQNHCCDMLDLECFEGDDFMCKCTLECLSQGGDNCAVDCGAGPLEEDHATDIFDCGVSMCPNLCG